MFEARSIVIEEHLLYPVEMIDRLPNSRNPTILVFEVRSIAIEEHLYTLSKLSIDSLGFGRLSLIRWRSLRFAESIFGAMVLGSIYVDDYRLITAGLIKPAKLTGETFLSIYSSCG